MEQTIINRNEKPNSYEFGKASNRWKLYFNDAEELKKLIDDLVKKGFICFPESEA
jgi:polyhydroxyalkanoate synthesis regulator phasin